jgi:magnesium transporter
LLREIPIASLIGTDQDCLALSLIRKAHSIDDCVSTDELVSTARDRKTDRLVVVDEKDRPVGVVHTKDLLEIAIARDRGKTLRAFTGAHHNERATDNFITTFAMRYKWLVINLATALLATFTVSLFENTLSQMIVLASYMPLVAGMGGNAGAQAVSVTVRGVALGEVTKSNALRIVVKELLAGLLNGVVVGSLMTCVAIFIGQSAMLGLVLGLALVINLVVAGIFGAGVPITLKALKLDPAISATVFVTTATDVLGFIAFLGLARLILL